MKVCIFGADGRTGVEVVTTALQNGYEVVAFIYNDTFKQIFPKLVLVKVGNVLNLEDVQKAIKGCDSVISVIGHIKNSDPLMQTKGITNIVQSMKDSGIKRIISLTGTGVRFDGDKPSLFDKIGNIIIKFIDKDRIIDGIKHADILRNSNLDWTILRVLKLSQNDSLEVSYHLTEHGPAENLTSRKKVAKILVDLLTTNTYIGKAPVVSKK